MDLDKSYRQPVAGQDTGVEYDPDHFALADIIREQASRVPGRPCLTYGEATLTFADLHTRSSQFANALLATGVGPGDRIALLAKNSPVFYEAAFGVSKINAALVGLNWRLAAQEIEPILADADPSVVFVSDELRNLLPSQLLDESGPAKVVVLDRDYESWLAAASGADPNRSGGPDDVVVLLYTSGTTGVPKGAMLTNRNMSYSPRFARIAWGFGSASVNLLAMPLFHIGGLGYGLSALGHGGHTVVLSETSPPAILKAIQDHRVTHAFFVPAVIQTLLNTPGLEAFDLSSLKLIIYGASPISDAVLLRAMEVFGSGFSQAYGMTETAGTIVSLAPQDHDPGGPRSHLLRSCGKPLPWNELILADHATGKPVDRGAVGEIWVRSGQNTKGYRNRPEATAEAITKDGWLRTGDAAYQDDEGYIYLYDRFKDMIVSGGENVYPAEVENVLYDHPAVAEVAVIGVPSEKWGETVKAIVVPRAGASVAESELMEFSRSRLARYKCPTSVEFREGLPRNSSGKVLKKELREAYWQGDERRIH